MTTLREAAQMALDAMLNFPDDISDDMFESIKALRAALAQPEQEPVAWMYDWYDETEDIDGVPIGGIVSDCISKDYDEAHSPTMGCHNIRPLYTAPPQREWQGLTEAEHTQIAIDCGCASADWVFYGAAVERKLKEKNNG